jgi:serine/threonine-protein kinase
MTENPSTELLALQEAVAGRYFVDREIGRGGMGVVYLARDLALDRLVAIKLLPPNLAASSELRARFVREARTAAQLSHPNIVPIHAVEEHASLVFFVMGYVDGETLGERVRRGGPLASTEATRVMQEVAWALAHAHARGVVHRDVKPDNILLERETGRAMVTDFGIARVADWRTPVDGVIVGTPQYMSPEQARGEPADARSDLYSLGATFFFAVTGRLAIAASTTAALVTRLGTESAPSVTSVRSVVGRPLAAAVDRCLERAAERRFSSAAELAETLRAALAERPETPRPIRQFLAALDGASAEAGTAFVGSAMSLAALWSYRDNLFGGVVFYILPPVLGMLGTLRLARLTGDARALLRAGYGLDDLRRAITREARTRAEQDEAASRPRLSWRTMAWLAGGFAASYAGLWLSHSSWTVPSLLGLGTALFAPTITLRRFARDWLGGMSVLRRLVQGRFGRWLLGAAGIGLREPARPRVSGAEPTVVAIARAADELYLALPATQRRQLGDVRGVIDRLETEALALRDGEPAMAEREASAVAALEALRLDLLRLSAGGAPKGELTRDLEEAERIGNAIDAELANRDEPSPVPNA